jgi:alpha-glucosidase
MARLTTLLLLSLRGNAFLYQGEELGLPQAEVAFERLKDPEAIANWPLTLGRDGARTPMPWKAGQAHAGFSAVEPWLPVDPRHDALAADVQRRDPASTLNFTRRVLRFRRDHPALVEGELDLLSAPDPVVAFERRGEGERLVCVFNLGREPVAWSPPGGRWRLEVSTHDLPAGVAPPEVLAPLCGYVATRS